MPLYDKANWARSRPQSTLTVETISRLVESVLPARVVKAELMAGGLANSIYKLYLHSQTRPVLLRIYDRDPTACRKEADIYRLVRPTVPVPDIIHSEPNGIEGVGPFLLMEYVEGITFRQLKATHDGGAIAQAARSAGQTLAAIGSYMFSSSGWLGPGPSISKQFEQESCYHFLGSCLGSQNLLKRMDPQLVERVDYLASSWASRLASLDLDRRLVHCDFNSPNLMVQRNEGTWKVAAVIDWEFAIAGSPLLDIGNFIRYEHISNPRVEPHFSTGYTESGGNLPDDWRRLARVVDLTSLCEILTREHLPHTITSEVLGLILATVNDIDGD